MLAWGRMAGKRGAVVIGLAVTLLSTAAVAQQSRNECPPSRTPIKLNFKTNAPEPIFNHRLNVTGIANLLRVNGMSAPTGQRALGITLTKTMFGLQGASAAMRRGENFCVYLTEVNVEFGWSRVEVYVPSEFPRGSCEYRTVLDHENQHVAINRRLLREFAPRMRARIETILRGYKPLAVRRPEGSADAALDDLNRQMSGMLREFEQLHASRNAAIDSPANYRALAAMCKDWNRGAEGAN